MPKKVTYFYLPGCPYCRQADRAIEELKGKNPEYAAVEFERIDETARPEIANRYDYYYVPSMFIGEKKIYESHSLERPEECRAHVEEVFRKALDG